MRLLLLCLLLVPVHARAVGAQAGAPDYAPGQVIAAFHPNVSPRLRSSCLRLAQARMQEALPEEAVLLAVSPGAELHAVQRLRSRPEVRFAEPNYIRRAQEAPDDPEYYHQWHIPFIRADAAWSASTGAGAVVAVLDSGISSFGPDGFGSRVIGSYNALAGLPGRAEDYNGHGTHVAGTVAQETGNGIGTAGAAPDAELLAVKVLNRFGFGLATGIARGIRWAADNGAHIINLSLGSRFPSVLEKEAVAYAAARGVLVVAAAGNSGGAVMFPARLDEVVAVGAVTAAPFRPDFSCYGPELAIVAPGVSIRQETFVRWPRLPLFWGYPGVDGTSCAAPLVSAVAALVKSIHPDWEAAELRQAITATAADLGPPGRDDEYGWGLVDAAAAVAYE